MYMDCDERECLGCSICNPVTIQDVIEQFDLIVELENSTID